MELFKHGGSFLQIGAVFGDVPQYKGAADIDLPGVSVAACTVILDDHETFFIHDGTGAGVPQIPHNSHFEPAGSAAEKAECQQMLPGVVPVFVDDTGSCGRNIRGDDPRGAAGVGIVSVVVPGKIPFFPVERFFNGGIFKTVGVEMSFQKAVVFFGTFKSFGIGIQFVKFCTEFLFLRRTALFYGGKKPFSRCGVFNCNEFFSTVKCCNGNGQKKCKKSFHEKVTLLFLGGRSETEIFGCEQTGNQPHQPVDTPFDPTVEDGV